MNPNFLENFKDNFRGENIKKLKFWENPFKMFFPKRMVGVDIGTSSIKIVELSRWGHGKTLENYGEIKSKYLYKEVPRGIEKKTQFLSNYFVARAIRAVLDEARIKTRAAVFSIPDFLTFCTSFELPPMTEKEVPEAVYYNASQYIPLPITEATLDFSLVEGMPGDKNSKLKIFLVAIPNQVIQDYRNIAQMAGIDLWAVESESGALVNSLIKEERSCVCLIDIGVQSTIVSIVDKKKLRKSYSLDFGGGQLEYGVASALGLTNTEAEEIKNSEGLLSTREEISKTLYLLIDPLIIEVKKLWSKFYLEVGKDIDVVYLSGGTANLSGLKEYFAEVLKKKVEIPNCFSDLLYPPILEETLKKIAPSFSVAVGAALGQLEV